MSKKTWYFVSRGIVISGVFGLTSFPLPAYADGNLGIGIEGFYDKYTESEVKDTTDYGSLTGYYSYSWGSFFAAWDGRASYGEDNYSSPVSGDSSGAPQWEFDTRVRGGLSQSFGDSTLSEYIGVGVRYFEDQGKGTVTNQGDFAYDRRILQYYAPIGTTYSFDIGDGWVVSPNIEYDVFLYGMVNSRLLNGGGDYTGEDPYNIQSRGYGLRGELMTGQAFGSSGASWQIGPFFRYWKIDDSNVVPSANNPGYGWVEPNNTRLQVGLALRALW